LIRPGSDETHDFIAALEERLDQRGTYETR
jgi:hypothetical protein